MPASPLHLRCWNGQCVAYDERSGDTHLLSALAGEVFSALKGGAPGFDDLARQTACALGVDPDAEFLANLKRTLSELQAKGLASGLCFSPD